MLKTIKYDRIPEAMWDEDLKKRLMDILLEPFVKSIENPKKAKELLGPTGMRETKAKALHHLYAYLTFESMEEIEKLSEEDINETIKYVMEDQFLYLTDIFFRIVSYDEIKAKALEIREGIA